MFKIVQRYLAFSFIPPFIISTLFFISFLLTFQLFRITKLVINKGVGFSTVMGLIGHIAMSFIPMAVPLSILFAMIFALNKLGEDSEIIAMRSFGITKFQLFAPFLILGIFISLAVFSLNQNIIPLSKRQFKNTIVRLTSKGMLTDIREGHFFMDIPKVTLFAEKVEDKGKKLRDVFIHLNNKDGKGEKVIFARKGILKKEQIGEWSAPNLRLHLSDGNITKTFTENNDVEKILYEEYEFPLLNEDYRPSLVEKDSTLTSRELIKLIREESKKQKPGVFDKSYIKSQMELWTRINTPFQCLIFILLGFVFGVGRSKSKNTGAMVMFILVLYYVVFFTGISFAQKGFLPSSVAIFLPTFLALVVGIQSYRKLDWLG